MGEMGRGERVPLSEDLGGRRKKDGVVLYVIIQILN